MQSSGPSKEEENVDDASQQLVSDFKGLTYNEQGNVLPVLTEYFVKMSRKRKKKKKTNTSSSRSPSRTRKGQEHVTGSRKRNGSRSDSKIPSSGSKTPRSKPQASPTKSPGASGKKRNKHSTATEFLQRAFPESIDKKAVKEAENKFISVTDEKILAAMMYVATPPLGDEHAYTDDDCIMLLDAMLLVLTARAMGRCAGLRAFSYVYLAGVFSSVDKTLDPQNFFSDVTAPNFDTPLSVSNSLVSFVTGMILSNGGFPTKLADGQLIVIKVMHTRVQDTTKKRSEMPTLDERVARPGIEAIVRKLLTMVETGTAESWKWPTTVLKRFRGKRLPIASPVKHRADATPESQERKSYNDHPGGIKQKRKNEDTDSSTQPTKMQKAATKERVRRSAPPPAAPQTGAVTNFNLVGNSSDEEDSDNRYRGSHLRVGR